MPTKVLLIEDVMENRYLVSYLLTSYGWQVQEAVDGVSALEQAPGYRPDLILLDIGLPGGLDGYNLVGLLRAIPALERVPIIAVTSYAMGGDRETALAAGCDGYIEKPINADTFVEQIETVMRESQP